MKKVKNFIPWFKSKPKKTKIILIIVGLIIFCCICSFSLSLLNLPSDDDTESAALAEEAIQPSEVVNQLETITPPKSPPTSEPTMTQKPTIEPLPTETLDPKEALKVRLDSILGEDFDDKPRLVELDFDNPAPGEIYIKFNISDNLFENLIKYGAKRDISDILQALDESGIDFNTVLIEGSFPMVDNFGNESLKDVVALFFDKPTVDKINWKNFNPENIYSIADDALIYPGFED